MVACCVPNEQPRPPLICPQPPPRGPHRRIDRRTHTRAVGPVGPVGLFCCGGNQLWESAIISN